MPVATNAHATQLADLTSWPTSPERAAISSDGRYFAYLEYPRAAPSKLMLVDLRTTVRIQAATDVSAFQFARGSAPTLVIFKAATEPTAAEGAGELVLKPLNGRIPTTIEGVVAYALAPSLDRVAWANLEGKHNLGAITVLDLRNGATTKLGDRRYVSLQWSPSGNELGGVADDTEGFSLQIFSGLLGHTPSLAFDSRTSVQRSVIGPNSKVQWLPNEAFAVVRTPTTPLPSASITSVHGMPIIARSQDPLLPWARNYSLRSGTTKVSLISLANQRITTIATETILGEQVITPRKSSKWIFIFDHGPYLRTANITGDFRGDLYAVEPSSGTRRLIVADLADATGARSFQPSPDGSKVLFWKRGSFHVADVESGRVRDLVSHGEGPTFLDAESDRNSPDTAFVPASGFCDDGNSACITDFGWAADSNTLILSDGRDLWKFTADGSSAPINLTTRAGSNVRWLPRIMITDHGRSNEIDSEIDPKGYIYLAPFDSVRAQGLARIDLRSGELLWLIKPTRYFFGIPVGIPSLEPVLLKARNADAFIVARGNFAAPRTFFQTDHTFKKLRHVADAEDKALANFDWSPGYRILNYRCNGRDMNGILYLPYSYRPGIKYPAIVEIYERGYTYLANAFEYHHQTPLHIPNLALYTSKGYAFFLPDISYAINNPMVSAVECAKAGVTAAVADGVIDPAHVGLYGFSFGATEANFVVTQTDIFAAAVASEGSDLLFKYDVETVSGRPGSTASDFSQNRMLGPLDGEHGPAFVRNSAVLNAWRVKTPLLMTANDRDTAEEWSTQMQYFNALRRADRNVTLLDYPIGDHGFSDQVDAADLARRTLEFFDYYLKGGPKPQWLDPGASQ